MLDGQALKEGGVLGGDLGVIQDIGILADGPQAQAQAHSGADGVAVGAAVGQDAVMVVPIQIIGDLSSRQKHFLYLPPYPEN